MQTGQKRPLFPSLRPRGSRWGRRALPRLIAMAVLIAVTAINFEQRPATAGGDEDTLVGSFVALPISGIDGYFPYAWGCGMWGLPDPGPQTVLQYHTNWHCNYDASVGAPVTPNWGARFFGFHKQLIYGYNLYRQDNGWDRVETWDPSPGAVIPMKHGEPVLAPDTTCDGCTELPDDFKLPAAGGTLDTYTSAHDIGSDLVWWHNDTHGAVADARAANGGSDDMVSIELAPRDPLFFHFHNLIDDVHEDWLTHQAADVMIVFDRSGSMSLPSAGGGTKLDAAKDAANMFADLLEDGSSNTLGMVSFSTTANNPADMPLTNIAAAPAALSADLAPLAASGNTSIGGGLQVAQTTLTAGSNERKAILLLTDGMENSAPMIADVQASLDSTHLCSIGYGTASSLDGPKLRNLSELQGGIYVSDSAIVASSDANLMLKKFFVDCFSDIFDTFIGEDPIQTLGAGQLASSPTIHVSRVDDKLVFVLAWTNPVPAGTIQLSIGTPSGAMVDLTDPAVESEFGPTWHIVRFKAPYKGEIDGDWTARAIRPYRSFVNGFTSGAFSDVKQGAALIMDEIRRLCPGGCQNVLYYEDVMPGLKHSDHTSAYRTAVYRERGRHMLANVVEVNQPGDFAKQLGAGRWDLIIYASQHHSGSQPYDGNLTEQACSSQGPRAIVTDNRDSQYTQSLLRCLGAARTTQVNWDTISGDGQLVSAPLSLRMPTHIHGAFSYGLQPIGAGIVQANNNAGSAAVIALGTTGAAQRFFITALSRADARVRPFNLRDRNYTSEALHPAYRITPSYWPSGGYDSINATVVVTRPLQGLGNLINQAGSQDGGSIGGDSLTPRQAALLRLDPKQAGLIRTETATFPLYDDGTHGDNVANDHYWEAQLPPDFARYDGEYQFHAYFTLCRDGRCIQREATNSIIVDTKIDPSVTGVTQQTLPPSFTRKRTRVLITPRDRYGNFMGSGFANDLVLKVAGDVRIERKGDVDGKGTYEVIVNWTTTNGPPSLIVAQPGRPGDTLKVPLSP